MDRWNFHHLIECEECAEPREYVHLSSPIEMSLTVAGAAYAVALSPVPRLVKRVPLVRLSESTHSETQARFKHLSLPAMSAFFIVDSIPTARDRGFSVTPMQHDTHYQ